MRLGAARGRSTGVAISLGPRRRCRRRRAVGQGAGCRARILTRHNSTDRAIIDAAKNRNAERATVTFSSWSVFGRVACDLALAFDARAGVYIAGGLGQALAELYAGSPFDEAFRDHPPYQDRLAAIPVHVILHPFPGLVGAQQIALAHLRRSGS